MDLLKTILECKEEELDSIIDAAIKEANANANQVDKLGFLDAGQSNSLFKGFIPLHTRISYSNHSIEDYGMETTDFLYEFARFVRDNNVNSKAGLIYSLETFVNMYFGLPGKAERETIFNDIAWQTTNTDDEYFEALENNKLGDLKGKGAAQCTERSALAQQVLSLFGVESYYCMGCVDLENRQEGHCFNVVKRQNDYALLDYSMPINSYDEQDRINAYLPFVGVLTNDEFIDFVNNGTLKSFEDYYIKMKEKVPTEKERTYVVGEYQIEKEEEPTNNINP